MSLFTGPPFFFLPQTSLCAPDLEADAPVAHSDHIFKMLHIFVLTVSQLQYTTNTIQLGINHKIGVLWAPLFSESSSRLQFFTLYLFEEGEPITNYVIP